MPKETSSGGSHRSSPYTRPQEPAISPTTAVKWDLVAKRLWDSTQFPQPANFEKMTNYWKKDARNVAVLLKKSEQASSRRAPEEVIKQRGLQALRGSDAYRWAVHNKPDDGLKYFWADETSGRIMEDVIYGSLHRQYDELVQKIGQDRQDIADQVDAAGRDSTLVLLERMLSRIMNAGREDFKADVDGALQHLSLDPSGPNLQIQKLTQENEGLKKQISELSQEMQENKRYLRLHEESSSRYRQYVVDVRLRTAKQTLLGAYDSIVSTLDRVALEDGGRTAVMAQPFNHKQTMRAWLISRGIHGGDLINDCEVISRRLVDARHGISARSTNGIDAAMPRTVTYSSFIPPPRYPRSNAKTWQEAFDKTFKVMHGIEALEARYILECLVYGYNDVNRTADSRVEARKTLMGHVEFIDKWVSIFEYTRFLASAVMKTALAFADDSWGMGWVLLRSVMTEQLMGRKKNGTHWCVRPVFYNYVALFAQACQLYNWGGQSAEEWSEELQRLDLARWDVYRLAFGTWTHTDINATEITEYDRDPMTGRHSRKPGSVPQTMYLWEEFNWIYQYDQWDHPQRRGPKQPQGAPELYITLEDRLWIQSPRRRGFQAPCGCDNNNPKKAHEWAMQKIQDKHDFS
ncbi:hypothetical protein QBC40DRAFT_268211 [Triangularia verruculosa]|uniref:Uncharacterized protein n=1 Tax=Triangularia verruculosa TaxID=2587418 RepID=A0AAN6XDW4_9PEZI|nr:hypothetical protein QBC40DRAFT_268211 [Triangularia verruculosa]